MIYSVTCKTVGCQNGGIQIEIENPENVVICGVCGIEISNKLKISDADTKEVI